MLTFTVCLVLAVLGGACAATLHKPPLSESEKCETDGKSGKMCIPDACSNTTCDVIPSAVCVADKCGCRARFFHFTQQDKVFAEVTRSCQAGLDVKVSKILGGNGSMISGRSVEDLDDETIQERHHKILLWIMKVRNPNMTTPTNDTDSVEDSVLDVKDENDMEEKGFPSLVAPLVAPVVKKVVTKVVKKTGGPIVRKVTSLLDKLKDEYHGN